LVSENLSNPWQEEANAQEILFSATGDSGTSTLVSIKPRAEAIEYEVKAGDTVSTIAESWWRQSSIPWRNAAKFRHKKPNQRR